MIGHHPHQDIIILINAADQQSRQLEQDIRPACRCCYSLPFLFILRWHYKTLWREVFLFSFLLVCFFAVPLNSTSFCAHITELAFTVKTCARALSSMWNPIRNSRQSIFWDRKQIVHRETFAAPESGCFDFRRFSTQVVPNRFTALVSAKLRIISCSQIKTNGENRHWFVDFTNPRNKSFNLAKRAELPHVME